MMVGHGLLAFAVVASVAAAAGWDRRRALAVGGAALAFATLPDLDMLYAVWGGGNAVLSGPLVANEAFWDASAVAHRSATHSLVVAVPTVAAVAVLVRRRSGAVARAVAVAALAAVAAVGTLASGPLDGVMLLAFGAGAVALAAGIARWTDLGWRAVALAALFGLASHPFGDLFTGAPPRILYPLGVRVFDGKVLLSADPTVHLLLVFALELLAVWLAAAVYLHVRGRSLRAFVDARAGVGVAYAGAAVVLPAPTLRVPTAFVFSILAVGAVLAAWTLATSRPGVGVRADGGSGVVGGPLRFEGAIAAVLSGTAAVTVAWVAYFGAYLLS